VLTPPRLNSALSVHNRVVKTEQIGLPEYRSIDMWCRFLETAHELGGDAERPRLSLSNSSTDQGGGKRRPDIGFVDSSMALGAAVLRAPGFA
jgi:hypothetical protein